MKTMGRNGIVMTALLSLLLLVGCSDESARESSIPALISFDKKTLEFRFGNGVTMKLVRIEAGTFMMGSKLLAEETARRFDSKVNYYGDEHPQHQVTLTKPFYIGVTEVTQAQWRAVMDSQPWGGKKYARAGADHAASYITWDDAAAFCRMLSKKTGLTVRLPTAAEWEYACRAGTTTIYGFGDDLSKLGDYAWYDDNTREKSDEYAHAVGVKKPNAWGLYDMHGNVWEWCADWYAGSYANAGAHDPKGPATGWERVLRGGSWFFDSDGCRAANCARLSPDWGNVSGGFRVVVQLQQLHSFRSDTLYEGRSLARFGVDVTER